MGAMFIYDIYPKNIGKTAAYDIAVKAICGAPMSNLALGDNADEIRSYKNMMLLGKIEMPEILRSRRVPKTLGPGIVSTRCPFSATRYA